MSSNPSRRCRGVAKAELDSVAVDAFAIPLVYDGRSAVRLATPCHIQYGCSGSGATATSRRMLVSAATWTVLDSTS